MNLLELLITKCVEGENLFFGIDSVGVLEGTDVVRFKLTGTGREILGGHDDTCFMDMPSVKQAIEFIEKNLEERGENPAENISLGILKLGLERFPERQLAKKLENGGLVKGFIGWDYSPDHEAHFAIFEPSDSVAEGIETENVGYEKQALIDEIADIRRILTSQGSNPKQNTDYMILLNGIEAFPAYKAEFDKHNSALGNSASLDTSQRLEP